MGKVRQPYEKPTAAELTPQKAKQKLLGLVNRGDTRAKKHLELMFSADGAKRLRGRRQIGLNSKADVEA
jgi:hypothetical protein